MDPEHEGSSQLAQFCAITGVSAEVGRQFLLENDGNLDQAMAHYYESVEGGSDEEEEPAEVAAPSHTSAATASGGRRLGDESTPPQPSQATAPPSTTRSSQASKPAKKRFASLRDLQGDPQSQDHDDDSDKDQEYFAGGDKSGLAVQEPGSGHNQHIQRLLDTARRNGPPPPRDESEPQRSNFSGQGQTLGGDDAPSQIVQDPRANTRRPPPMVERILHLWDDGFSIDDGPLYRYDDPANRRTLEMINRGSAPLDLMNVEPGQAVDVKLDAHRGEKYVQPKKKYTAFSGGGQRLGSPVPGGSGFSTPPFQTAPSAAAAQPTSTASTLQPSIDVNELEPTLTLQIRLADGTRLPSRFNTTHTIGDVYTFVNRASQASTQRPYTLATTFPTKELTDKEQVLGDMQEFKRGGVIVQKWQ